MNYYNYAFLREYRQYTNYNKIKLIMIIVKIMIVMITIVKRKIMTLIAVMIVKPVISTSLDIPTRIITAVNH